MKQKLKFGIYILFILIIIPNVLSEKKLIIQYREIENKITLENIYLIENNNYYLNYFIEQKNNIKIDYNIKLLDSNENILYEEYANYPPYLSISFQKEMLNSKKIIFQKKDGEVVIQKEINLCNNNGICEPCLDNNCNNFEDYLSCNDCSISSKDNFCNLLDDNICDPDCIWYTYDDTCYENKLLDMSCEENYLFSYTDKSDCNGEILISKNGLECCTEKGINGQKIEITENKTIIEIDNYTNKINENMLKNNTSIDDIINKENDNKNNEIQNIDKKNYENTNKNNKKTSQRSIQDIETKQSNPIIFILIFLIIIIIAIIFILLKKRKNNNQTNNVNNQNQTVNNSQFQQNNNTQYNQQQNMSLEEQYRQKNYGDQYKKN